MQRAVRVTGAVAALLLLPCAAIGAAAADTCGLVFRAEPVKDTFLLHEPVWIRFSAENTCDRPLAHWYLFLMMPHMGYEVIDDEGIRFPISGVVADGPIVMDTLQPGEVIEQFESLSPAFEGDFHDSPPYPGFLPERNWRATFVWQYEPRDTMKGPDRGCLHDTAAFSVVAPRGEDSTAMLIYVRAFDTRRRGWPYEERLWGLVHSFPESPYAVVALCQLCRREPIRPDEYYAQTPEVDPVRRLVLSFPDHPGGRSPLIGRAQSLRGGSRKGFLKTVTDSVPGTFAARRAQRLLDQAAFTYLPRGWTFSLGIGRLAHTGLAGAFDDRQVDAALSLCASRPQGLITAVDFGILLSTPYDEPGAFSTLRASVAGRIYPLRRSRRKQRDQVYAHWGGLFILAQRESDDLRTALGAEMGLGLDIDVNPKRTFFIELGLSVLTLREEGKLTNTFENFAPATAGESRLGLIWPVRLTVGMRMVP
ncbi:MAG TPA: hypothetical protein VM118_12595 [Acidobacteriota bacterium]|nr:hypothetical protein [Acidobacteriota bacterium]